MVNVRGFKAVLDVMGLSTRFPFAFLIRNKQVPLDIIQCLFDCLKRAGTPVHHIRVDEDRALAQC